jgi:hypothetical protein
MSSAWSRQLLLLLLLPSDISSWKLSALSSCPSGVINLDKNYLVSFILNVWKKKCCL